MTAKKGADADNGLATPAGQASACSQDVDLAIAMEPTDNTLQLGCMGGLQATVVTYPRQGRPLGAAVARRKCRTQGGAIVCRPCSSGQCARWWWKGLTFPRGGQRHLGALAVAPAMSCPDRFELNRQLPLCAAAPRSRRPPCKTRCSRSSTTWWVSADGRGDRRCLAAGAGAGDSNPIFEHMHAR